MFCINIPTSLIEFAEIVENRRKKDSFKSHMIVSMEQ